MLESGIQFEFSLPEFAHPNLSRPPAQILDHSCLFSPAHSRPPTSYLPILTRLTTLLQGQQRAGGRARCNIDLARPFSPTNSRPFSPAQCLA